MAFQKMRTAGREVIDPVEIERFLLSNHIIRVGLYDEDEGYPYIVPLNYGFEYDAEDGKLIFLYALCEDRGVHTASKAKGEEYDLRELVSEN